jgi:Spy/CpxP family protein refolding chaperone
MNDTVQPNPEKPKRPWKRIALATIAVVILVGAGAKIFAHSAAAPFADHCAFAGADSDAMAKRTDLMVRFMLSGVDATDAQQTKIADIAKSAISELRILREKHTDGHKAVAALLSQPNIDRAAIDSLRAEQIQLADAASRRIAQALADAAEVLTVGQRAVVVDRVQQFRSAHHR